MRDEVMFKEYMATLCEVHEKTMSPLLIDLYWKVLEPFDDDKCEEVFKVLIYSTRFFPKPADFKDLLCGKAQNRATEKWLEVLSAVKSVGNYRSVSFSEPVIHSVINAMGGWQQLCMMETKDEKWKQKEFERLYEVISERGGEHQKYLPGTHEMENFRTGYNIEQEIIQIGFKDDERKLIN